MALTDRQIRQANQVGVLIDGLGLRLKISATGNGALSKRWALRYTSPDGRRRETGLGGFPEVSLSEARKRAAGLRQDVRAGIDPLAARTNAREARIIEAARSLSFADCAARYITAHEVSWRNPKHRQQWSNTLSAYAFPVFGALPVDQVDQAMVMNALDPIWTVKPETASRLRGRIEAILDWASVRGYRKGDNPARWRGHLEKALPARAKTRRIEHHAAVRFSEMPCFWAALAAREGNGADCLKFLVLTAVRSGEARGARWGEIDVGERVWTIPAARMKGGREHRVPLSDPALAVLEARRALSRYRLGTADLVFESDLRAGAALSDMTLGAVLKRMGRSETVHGFRSSFRDWAAERTAFPREVAEQALAHTIGDKVEAAYRRGDLFEKRQRLMAGWAQFLSGRDDGKRRA